MPGLVLAALAWPEARVVLVDASQRRCTYLELEVAALGLADRVAVRWGGPRRSGATPACAGRLDVVISRSFGPPRSPPSAPLPCCVPAACCW